MRRTLLGGILMLGAAYGLAGAELGAKGGDEFTVAFLGPDDGADAEAVKERRAGVGIAIGNPLVTDPKISVTDGKWDSDPKKLATEISRLKKTGAAVLFASVPDGMTAHVEAAAVKAKLPLIVLSPEPTRPDLDAKRAVFWMGGISSVDESLAVMDFLYQPVASRFPAVLHDGTERAAKSAAQCHVLHHYSQAPKDPALVDASFGPDQAKAIANAGTDGICYFGGPEGAERLLRALAAANVELPVVLGQALASAGVPTFRQGKAPDCFAIEPVGFEDHGGVGSDAKWVLGDWEKETSGRAVPNVLRSYRAGRFVMDALATAKSSKPKHLVPALRALGRPSAAGKPVFEPWGHAALMRPEPWRSTADGEDWPACHRIRDTLMPMAGIPSVGFFNAKTFQWEEGTHYVWLTWVGDKGRTIENDLKAIGLGTGGYEADLEKRILDDLMGRVISKLNKLFLRNADGTAIPGVSYNISFTAEKPPKGVKAARRFNMLIAGDDPDAGGRASGITAWVFPTYIQRTMYVQHKLTPPIQASDRQYLVGTYKWGKSVAENLRGDEIRALVDGFTQAMSLTGAHEVGHLCGLGHDTTVPRSIMNVVEGGGLQYEWADWAPEHVGVVEKRLGRTPAEKKKRRR